MEEKVVISQVSSMDEVAGVQELLHEYIAWAFSLAEDSDKAPTFQGIEEELASLPGIYVPPLGRLLLATHNGKAAGCVCLKPHSDGTCEVKRLYVSPNMRGLAIGSQLIERLVEEARAAGYRRIVLDSHISMTKAHGIYEGVGFRRVEGPPEFPESLRPVAVFMELDLGEI